MLGVTVHGTTRNKQLAVLLKDLGLSISYTDILDIYSAWTLLEITDNPICPDEIAPNLPGIAVIDNDDFREDTLTG